MTTEPNTVNVPDHLQDSLSSQQSQGQSDQQNDQNEPGQDSEPLDMQAQMLAAMVGQGERMEQLAEQVKEIAQAQKGGKGYLSSLEQGSGQQSNPAAPPALDWHTMNQEELAQNVTQIGNYQLGRMANQFTELLEVIAPQWDGWEHREAIYGLVGQGYTFKQAYSMAMGRKTNKDNNTPGTKPAPDKESFQDAVNRKAAEIVAQQRGAKAGVGGKPNRNDAKPQVLTPRELNRQLFNKWVNQNEPIPDEYSRGA